MDKERPIIFNTPMVHAILEGKKSQTRRALRPQPIIEATYAKLSPFGRSDFYGKGLTECAFGCPYGQVGDRLWVRETFWEQSGDIYYKADWPNEQPVNMICDKGKWRPSIFMPRWASRILLEITEVRVQKVQEISPEDAVKEGAELMAAGDLRKERLTASQIVFASYWDSINAKRGYGWDKNPWVWAITFKRVE